MLYSCQQKTTKYSTDLKNNRQKKSRDFGNHSGLLKQKRCGQNREKYAEIGEMLFPKNAKNGS